MPEPGSKGIWKRTLDDCSFLLYLSLGAWVVYMWYGVERRWGCDDQFIPVAHDLWEDDGTELEGEEAVAYHRIWRERVMPYMDQLQEIVDAAEQ